MVESKRNVSQIMDRMRVYLFPWGKGEPPADDMIEFAVYAEELGYRGVNVPWHYTMPKTKSFKAFGTRYLLDPVVLVPMILARTSRIQVALEYVMPTLHPFVWAQYFASLDHASGGRALAVPVLGWWEEDYQAGMVPKSERGRRMDESLQTVRRLWEGSAIPEAGDFWDSSGLELNPRPVQQPFPVWIGGGEAQIDRTARYAQAIYPLFPTEEETRDYWVPLLDKAKDYGRTIDLAVVNYVLAHDDPDWFDEYALPRLIARINGITLEEALESKDDMSLNRPEERLMVGSNEECAQKLVRLLDAGSDHIVIDFYMHGWEPVEFGREQMRRFAEEIVPLAAEM